MRNSGRGWLTAALCAFALAAPAQEMAGVADGSTSAAQDRVRAVAIEAGLSPRELVVEFDRPMRIWDNGIDDGQVRTEPALPLRCAWRDDLAIVCSFAGDRQPSRATEYTVRLAAGLHTLEGVAVPASTTKVEYERPTLSGQVGAWKNGVATIELDADGQTDAQHVAEVLRLSVNGRDVPLPPLKRLPRRGEWDTGARFELELTSITQADARVVLSHQAGLRSTEGPLRGTGSGPLVDVVINEPFRLRGVVCNDRDGRHALAPVAGALAIDCLPGEPIRLVFSHRLHTGATAWAAKQAPDVKLHGQPADIGRYEEPLFGADKHRPQQAPSQAWELSIDAPNVERRLALDDSLRSARGGSAVAPVDLRIRLLDYRPSLQAPHAKGLIADGHRPPALLSAVNVRRLETEITGLSDRAWNAPSSLSASAANVPTEIAIPRAAASTLAKGGWLEWRLPQGEALQFAAPAFDLFAVAGRRQVLAWASDWNGGGAVAGASVELLLRDSDAGTPRVVASGTTAADGTVVLRLPGDVKLPERISHNAYQAHWWLRATNGGGRREARAVLALGQSNDWQFKLGKGYERKLWGVADKPLYRAGETVRYRLWRRELHGTRLKDAPRDLPQRLQLIESWGKTIQAWDAVADESGAFQGELKLPEHLPDNRYCIGVGADGDTEGSCFFVGTYRGQDLWAQANAQDRLLRAGDRFEIELSAGYYSGGAAADARISDVSGMLTGLPLETAYPQYGDYGFVDVNTDAASEGIRLRNEDEPLRTDREGHRRLSLPVAFKLSDPEQDQLPAFGRLQVTVSVTPSEREGTTSNAVQARYAGYERYVGLRTDPAWSIDRDKPLQLDAVVIDAEGHEIADAPVEVEVHHVDDATKVLQRCVLIARRPAPCDFPRAEPGEYRLVARSGTAAPATISRYLWDGPRATAEAVKEPALRLERTPAPGATKVTVQLSQPYAKARVLLVSRDGDRMLAHRVATMSEPVQSFDIELGDEPGRNVDLQAYVLDADIAEKAVDADGFRTPPARSETDLRIELPRVAPRAAAVEPRFDAASARPGDSVGLILHNRSAQTREVTVTVLDDAVRALAGEEWALFDPQGKQWLSADTPRYGNGLFDISFRSWLSGPWRMHLPWPSTAADADTPILERVEVVGSRVKRADVSEENTSLDRIEVTGSRIALKDIFSAGTGRLDAATRPRDTPSGLQALARVRTQFADTAQWMPALRLAPGESRRIELKLPDNLTRWRAVVWNNGADEDFDMSEATLEVGLPLEVRLQAPARLYPGDRARLAANVRQSDEAPVAVRALLQTQGAAATQAVSTLALSSRGQTGYAAELSADAIGSVLATAAVEAGARHDAVAAPIEVASPWIEASRRQAGWLDGQALDLPLPTLPDGALESRLQLSLQRGSGALLDRWTADLRDYPHRCWEQILSRAVAAALALQRDGAAHWPEAKAVVREALDNAAVFQDDDGGFRYFVEDGAGYQFAFGRDPRDQPQVALTAYSADALQLLQDLGHAVPAPVRRKALAFLKTQSQPSTAKKPTSEQSEALNRWALAAGALGMDDAAARDGLWRRWSELSLPAQVALTRGLARSGDDRAKAGLAQVLSHAPARGPSRVLSTGADYERWMSSNLREQCALIDLLRDYPALAAAGMRRELIAGLTDLYAGGSQHVDTQSGAVCLAALRDDAVANANETFVADVGLGTEHATLTLAPGQTEAQWRPQQKAAGSLTVAPGAAGTAPVAYLAEVVYREDARRAQASAAGLSIERRYAVLRGGRWVPVAQAEVRAGDWLRVSLRVHNGATRHFVAITDEAPGGLRPSDLSLNGVAGLDLKRVSDTGSYWFTTRRLDARSPRFYAEYLPAGDHELHYFALAGNGGDYLAAPAQVELMYGKATHARTAAERLRILPPADANTAP
ncbi:MG2 domain-containing protein [Lysobacter sp. 5GHs7-4]|uniref:alpha-2-macroglobulin family protein n=1 Tax=Lysobacter sp. 5GHs7-4 TaxID=2904253 RepID=UPI001E440799|nr:MG2 domain-containing protein [Lysobacter sp. 5GHs7-4]UHQ23176.1 MG2 domain-containing protein [Lysobacter sp. 5GHs7-4]